MRVSCDHTVKCNCQHRRFCTRSDSHITKVRPQQTINFCSHIHTCLRASGLTFAHIRACHPPHNPQLAPRTCVRREVGVALQWHIFCFVNRDVVIPMRTPNFTRTVPGIALPVQWYSSVDFHSFSQVDLYSLVYCCYYLYLHVNLHVPSDVYCLFVHGLVCDLALAVLIVFLLVPFNILLSAPALARSSTLTRILVLGAVVAQPHELVLALGSSTCCCICSRMCMSLCSSTRM